MNLFYPVNNKPAPYMFLLVSMQSLIVFYGNIYNQAIVRKEDILSYKANNVYIEHYIESEHRTISRVTDLKLVAVGTTSSASAVLVQLANWNL